MESCKLESVEEKQIEQTRLDLAYYRGYSDAIEKVLKLLIRESDE